MPETWEWTTLGKIGDIVTGNTPSKDISDYYGGEIPFFKPTDLEQGINTFTSKDYLTKLGFEQSRKLPAKSVLVTCIGATIGKTGLILTDGTCNQQINAIVPSKAILSTLLYYVCVSDYFQQEMKDNASATTLPILNKSNFAALLIPLPPLAEQRRIVSEIEKWFSLIDIIENGKANLQTIVKQAKSKILDLAIHGKLVPQDPSDEPASELLRNINPKAEITSDNAHYQNLPSGWAICHINDISESFLGKTLDKAKDTGESKKYLCALNVQWGRFDFTTLKEFRIEDKDKERYSVKKGDLLVCEGGDVGRCAIWNSNSEMYYQNALHRVRCKQGVSAKYILYSLQYFKLSGVIDDMCKGVTIKHFTQTTMNKLPIPLPPLAEQSRIVAKIEEIFHQLDMIEESL